MKMHGYYFSFQPTGILEIDKILCAVASAGKAFHHTEDWNDECGEYADCVGRSPVEWIQNAANDAANAIKDSP